MQEQENSKGSVNEGKGVDINDKTTVIVSTPEADKKNTAQVANAKKMIEANSIRVETIKKEKLKIDPNNLNETDLPSLLSREDNDFYLEKKALYINSYPELQEDPFDLDELHLMLMEQVVQRNLWKRKKKRPSIDIDKLYEASVKRHEGFKKSLSVRRTDRQKIKGEKKQQLNIANLSINFSDKDKMAEFTERAMLLKEEEANLGLLAEGKVFE